MSAFFDSKPYFQRLLRPTTRGLARAGVTANQVTVATITLSLAAGAAVALWPERRWPLLIVPCALLARLAFNHIDGMLAREHGMKTPLGGMINELGDAICDAALYLPLAAVPGVSPWLVVPAAFLGLLSEMTGLSALAIAAERRFDGPLAKKPRGVLFGVAALVLGLGVAPGPWLDLVLLGVIVLSAATVLNRGRRALERVSP